MRQFPGFRARIRRLLQELSTSGTSFSGFAAAASRLPGASAELRAFASIATAVEARLVDCGLETEPEAALPDSGEGAASLRIEKFSALRREQETSEIARRIAQSIAGGQHTESIAVLLREEKPYAALLGTAFARFGIPGHFHFPLPIEHHPVIRYLSGVIEALLSGWDWSRLIDVFSLAISGYGATEAGDELDYAMRERLPAQGLADLGDAGARFEAISGWETLYRTPPEWAAALGGLREWIDAGSIHQALPALTAWDDILATAAMLLPERTMPLGDFWPEVRMAIRLSTIPPEEPGVGVVPVLGVAEAANRKFDTVFVCGAVEDEFPKNIGPDAILSDAQRVDLRQFGIMLPTTAERQEREDRLFDVVLTRGATTVTFSWPRFHPSGRELAPSLALSRFDAEVSPARDSRPEISSAASAADRLPASARANPELISRLIPAGKKWRPSEIESFLQCPFQYLGRYTLRLVSAPLEPSERFDPRQQGSLVHFVLGEMRGRPISDLNLVFEDAFHAIVRKANIVVTHRVEWDRLEMLRALRAFLSLPEARPDWQSFSEWSFELPLAASITVRGRIDRFDCSADGEAFAIDYKYSRADSVRDRVRKNETGVQGGLYLSALEHAGYRPTGFAYVPLRGDGRPVELSNPTELMADTRERVIDAITRIGQGDIAVRPANPGNCRFCDFRTVCRVREEAGLTLSAGSDI